MFDPKKKVYRQKIREFRNIKRTPLLLTNGENNKKSNESCNKTETDQTIIVQPIIDSSLRRLIELINQII